MNLWIDDQKISVDAQKTVMESLLFHGYYVDNPCNGRGTCGKCKVKVNTCCPEATLTERKHLSNAEILEGVRLACTLYPEEGMSVSILKIESDGKVLTEGVTPSFTMDERSGYGFAVDIGTTTIVVEMLDLKTGQVIHQKATVNPQKRFGSDVLSRITYAAEHGEAGVDALQMSLVHSLNAMMESLCDNAKVDREEIIEIVIACNTTMAHTLLGVDPTPLGRFPYAPAFVAAQQMKARAIGLDVGRNTELYVLPHVSAFIGADIVAGTLVSGIADVEETSLFVDIGTNGEIVLAKDRQLYCCSCAAGPALEGMNISSGMRAEPGAIEDVKFVDGAIRLKTIDDILPSGICGSGILAILRELIAFQFIRQNGTLIKRETLEADDWRLQILKQQEEKRYIHIQDAPVIKMTQSDIRQVQLAKGAILSGVNALLKESQCAPEDVAHVYVAGQFGAHLPESSLLGTGILPVEFKGKIEYLGNSSKTGAMMALLNRQIREDMNCLAQEMQYIELATREDYEKIFRNACTFQVGNH